MAKSSKALIISLVFLGLAQWLIFTTSMWGLKLALTVLFFLGAFIWAENKHSSVNIIFRNLLPLMLSLGILSFILFEKNVFLQEAMVIFTAIAFYLFYSRRNIPLPANVNKQVTYFWLDLIILLTIYLISLAIYQLIYFANLPLWLLIICLALLGGALFGYGLWARRVVRQVMFVYLSLFVLITVEVFVILSFWQEAFPLYKALILALLYYIYMGLLDFKLKGERLRHRYLGYLIFAIVAFILILFSVEWRTFF